MKPIHSIVVKELLRGKHSDDAIKKTLSMVENMPISASIKKQLIKQLNEHIEKTKQTNGININRITRVVEQTTRTPRFAVREGDEWVWPIGCPHCSQDDRRDLIRVVKCYSGGWYTEELDRSSDPDEYFYGESDHGDEDFDRYECRTCGQSLSSFIEDIYSFTGEDEDIIVAHLVNGIETRVSINVNRTETRVQINV